MMSGVSQSSGTVQRIDVKAAIQKAKAYVVDAFSDDHVERIALEEIAFDDEHSQWLITIGFNRPWDQDTLGEIEVESGQWSVRAQELRQFLQRTYKVVHLAASDGRVTKVENRTV